MAHGPIQKLGLQHRGQLRRQAGLTTAADP